MRKKTLTEIIAVRVSPREKALLEKVAEKAGLPISTWLRLKLRVWLKR